MSEDRSLKNTRHHEAPSGTVAIQKTEVREQRTDPLNLSSSRGPVRGLGDLKAEREPTDDTKGVEGASMRGEIGDLPVRPEIATPPVASSRVTFV